MCTSMATFYSYLLVFHCLSLAHGQLQMEINRDSSLGIDDSFKLPRNTTECLFIGDIPSPSCFKYRASPQRQRRTPCWCSCFPLEVSRSLFFEPSNSCLEVSLARRRSGCDLLFTDETAQFAISSISPIGVTQKAINVPANSTCSFYFGEKLHAQYIGCDGDWREIPSNSVNESLEVTPGWNTSQLILRTRDTASSFLRKNPGRIFRVAVQCRHQRKKAVAKSTCVMFKVPGTIYCPIPQQNSSKQSATLPPPTLEITSTTGFPPRPTTQAEKETTSRIKAIDIVTYITIPENEGRVLNCTKDRFDGKHEWSRKDGEPAVTTTRILTEDTRLNITDASVEDAGEYICRNGPTVTHRFVITVEVFVKVQMIVKVLNYEYTPQLQNKSSQAYIETEKNFTAEMDKLYNDTPGYVRTEVLNFTKGSVNVDFRVIIVISATDPKNASAIPDAKAETTHQVVREAKTGFVKQLQVSPVVEVFSPPLEPRGIEIFDKKSDKLGVRWEPSEDADAFKVESYHVQYRELLTEISQNASVPSTEKKDTYSYLIKDLEPKTTYMIRVGAENRHGINFNEETASKTLDPPFAEWIIVLIVLGILLVIGIIVGLIVFKRRRAEQRRKKLKEEEDGRFGGLSGDVRLASVPNYETKNVKGIKFSFANKSFMPSEANWEEIPYEKITLMNELGSGAFGVVYKGELKQDNGNVTPCAVKTLKESATTEEIRDLYNELEIMTNVGYHPNLVNLLGACTQDGHLLVVIEIAENGNLLEFLRKSRETNQNYGNIQGTVLTNDMRLRIATDVAKGMAHLANGRWIHRDLAARNVLLAKNYVAKVADYGMARDIYEQLMYKKETQGKLPVKWMAIESLETYIFTTESDVWSYGVLLWEMESGGLKPYAGLSALEQIDQLKKGYRLEKPDGCSDAVYQIMRDCWNPNPKARPTFDDLVTRLENMADSS